MNLKSLSDQVLLAETKDLVQRERMLLTSILHHLREVERRRLFSALGFSSLFEYSVSELKYSKDQAFRRISAMRLLKELPEIEKKISSGALSLTNLGLAQTLFSKEKQAGRALSADGKAAILVRLENRSTRDAQKVIGEINPELKCRRLRLDFESIEDMALKEKLLRVKGRLAHIDPHMTLEQLLHRLCDNELARSGTAARSSRETTKSLAAPRLSSPMAKSVFGSVQNSLSKSAPKSAGTLRSLLEDSRETLAPHQPGEDSPAPGKVSELSHAEVRRLVWRRDQGACTNCGSVHALQMDHVIPRAAGGKSTVGNLRLLCRPCNQRAAMEYFGVGKVNLYLKSPSVAYLNHVASS